jgi:hypothetical protein
MKNRIIPFVAYVLGLEIKVDEVSSGELSG